jgi:predicted GNAT superfamily acetyltransferase
MATIEKSGNRDALNDAASASAVADIASVEIRHCDQVPEFQACVDLQREVWGFSDAELVPVRMFVVAHKIGGQVIGAFSGPSLVGFAMSIPGVRNGHPYLHSQMLAVKAAYRNGGLGRQLKLVQREEAISRGFELMEWTFDPLEIKNAYLNIEKLGAIVRRYSVNQYGITTSPLQAGLPTDRCIAEWWLQSSRVRRLLETQKQESFAPEKTITVPALIYKWKSDPAKRDRARDVQLANREQFLNAFGRGLAVLGYSRDPEGNGSYLLAQPRERFEFSSTPKF